MNVQLEYKNTLDDMVAEILRSEKLLESEQAELMQKVGKIIKGEVQTQLARSEKSGGDYKHMKDDVKVTVSGKKTGDGVMGVVVHGGKKTAYKWHMLDDGTRNPDGTVHTPATHFTQKALKAAEPKIEQLINELEKKVVEA